MILDVFVYVSQSYLLVCSGSGTESIFLGVFNKLIITKMEYSALAETHKEVFWGCLVKTTFL